MAELTANLPVASSSRRIIDPGDSGPSWLQGLASGAAKAVTNIGNEMDAQAANRRRDAATEAKAREDAAKNQAAALAIDHALGRGVFGNQVEAANNNLVPNNVGIDAEVQGAPPPADVVNSVDEAVRARAAETQGRAPSGSSRIVLERALNKLLADYPDQTANILKEFRDNGFDHYLMRERDTAEQLYDAQVAGTIKQTQTFADAAVAAGAVLPGTSLEQAARIGQDILHQEYTLKRKRDEAAASAAAAAEGRTQTNFSQEQADREVTTNFQATLSSVLAPSFAGIKNLFTQSNGDQSVLELIPETLNSLDVTVNNIITAAMQNDAPPSTVEAMRTEWKTLRPQIVELVSGPGSELSVATAVLEGMQTRLDINMIQALPVMTAMKDMFGMAGLEAAFGENPAQSLPPEIITSIKNEIKGVSGAIDTDGERVSMATVAQLLRGQLHITQMDERAARVAIPAMVVAARGQVADIGRGQGNTQSYVNANIQVVNAAMEIQPGNSNARTEAVVAGNVYTNEARAADVALMRRNPQEAAVMIESKRAAAMHLIQNINNASFREHPSDTLDGLWSVAYVNGRYQTIIEPQRYTEWARTHRNVANAFNPSAMIGTNEADPSGSGGTVDTIDALRRAGPPRGLADRIGAINLMTDYLVDTNQFDDKFQGVSASEARDFIITGRTPQAMAARAEQQQAQRAPLASQVASYRTMLDTQRTESEQLMANEVGRRQVENAAPPAGEVQNKVKTTAEAFGIPWDVVNRLVTKESGWDTGARNGDTGASGLFQVNDNVRRSVDENIQTGLSMFRDAQQGAQRILGRAATAADAYVMYQQGAGGGGAILNPANARKSAEEVLTQVYGNAATARQAITANGGNLNMTAAQFAQHIRDYFNR